MSRTPGTPSGGYDNPFSGLAERLSQAINKIDATLTPQKPDMSMRSPPGSSIHGAGVKTPHSTSHYASNQNTTPNTSGVPAGFTSPHPITRLGATAFNTPTPDSPSILEPADDSPHHRLVHPPSSKAKQHPVVSRVQEQGGALGRHGSSPLAQPQNADYNHSTTTTTTTTPIYRTPQQGQQRQQQPGPSGGAGSIRSRLAQRALQRTGNDRATQSFSRQQLVHPPIPSSASTPTTTTTTTTTTSTTAAATVPTASTQSVPAVAAVSSAVTSPKPPLSPRANTSLSRYAGTVPSPTHTPAATTTTTTNNNNSSSSSSRGNNATSTGLGNTNSSPSAVPVLRTVNAPASHLNSQPVVHSPLRHSTTGTYHSPVSDTASPASASSSSLSPQHRHHSPEQPNEGARNRLAQHAALAALNRGPTGGAPATPKMNEQQVPAQQVVYTSPPSQRPSPQQQQQQQHGGGGGGGGYDDVARAQSSVYSLSPPQASPTSLNSLSGTPSPPSRMPAPPRAGLRTEPIRLPHSPANSNTHLSVGMSSTAIPTEPPRTSPNKSTSPAVLVASAMSAHSTSSIQHSPYGTSSGNTNNTAYSPALSSLTSLSDDTGRGDFISGVQLATAQSSQPSRSPHQRGQGRSPQHGHRNHDDDDDDDNDDNNNNDDDVNYSRLSEDIPEPQRRAIERVRTASRRMKEAREAAALEAMERMIPDPDEIRHKEEVAAAARLRAQQRVAAARRAATEEKNAEERSQRHRARNHHSSHAHHTPNNSNNSHNNSVSINRRQSRTRSAHDEESADDDDDDDDDDTDLTGGVDPHISGWSAEPSSPSREEYSHRYPPTTQPRPRRSFKETKSESAAYGVSYHTEVVPQSDDSEAGSENQSLLDQLREQQIQARHRKVVQDMQRKKEEEQKEIEARKNRVKWARERANRYHREQMASQRSRPRRASVEPHHDRPWGASVNYHKSIDEPQTQRPSTARATSHRPFKASRSESGPPRPRPASVGGGKRSARRVPSTAPRAQTSHTARRPKKEKDEGVAKQASSKRGPRDYDKPWLSHARPVQKSNPSSASGTHSHTTTTTTTTTTTNAAASASGKSGKSSARASVTAGAKKGVSKVTSARRAKRRAELETRDAGSLAVTLINDLKALLFNALSLQEIMNIIRSTSAPAVHEATDSDIVNNAIELLRTHLDRVKRIYNACLDAAVEIPGHVEYDDEDGLDHTWTKDGQEMRFSDPSQISQERQQMDALRQMVTSQPLVASEATEVMNLLAAKLSTTQTEFDAKFEWARVVLLRRAETLNEAKPAQFEARTGRPKTGSRPSTGAKPRSRARSDDSKNKATRQGKRVSNTSTRRARSRSRSQSRSCDGGNAGSIHSSARAHALSPPAPISDQPPLAARFEQALKKMRSCDTGSFRDIPLDAKDLQRLVLAVKKSPGLKTLDLTHCQIGDDGATTLADALEQSATLSALLLGDNDIGYRGVWALAGALSATQLTHIDLSWNNVSEKGVFELSRAILSSHSLTSVDLSGVSMTMEGAKSILKSLHAHHHVQHLSLTWNNLDDEVGYMVADLLQHNDVLRVLNLSRNALGDRGAHFVSNALAKNQSLQEVNLGGNHIAFEGIRSLGLACMDNKTLKALGLDGNDIDERGIRALCTALKDNHTLQTVDLRYNVANQRAAETSISQLRETLQVMVEPQRDPSQDA